MSRPVEFKPSHRLKLRMCLNKAIEKAGSIANLAKLLGIRRQAVSQWEYVPLFRVLEVEKATSIPREELRPDIFKRQSK